MKDVIMIKDYMPEERDYFITVYTFNSDEIDVDTLEKEIEKLNERWYDEEIDFSFGEFIDEQVPKEWGVKPLSCRVINI